MSERIRKNQDIPRGLMLAPESLYAAEEQQVAMPTSLDEIGLVERW